MNAAFLLDPSKEGLQGFVIFICGLKGYACGFNVTWQYGKTISREASISRFAKKIAFRELNFAKICQTLFRINTQDKKYCCLRIGATGFYNCT